MANSWKDLFILKVFQGEFFRVLDKSLNLDKVGIWFNLRNTTMVAYEKVSVVGEFSLYKTVLEMVRLRNFWSIGIGCQ